MTQINQVPQTNQVQTSESVKKPILDKLGVILLIITACVTTLFIVLGCIFAIPRRVGNHYYTPNVGTEYNPYTIYVDEISNFSDSGEDYTYVYFTPTSYGDYIIYLNNTESGIRVVDKYGYSISNSYYSQYNYDNAYIVSLDAYTTYKIRVRPIYSSFTMKISRY